MWDKGLPLIVHPERNEGPEATPNDISSLTDKTTSRVMSCGFFTVFSLTKNAVY